MCAWNNFATTIAEEAIARDTDESDHEMIQAMDSVDLVA